MLLGEHDHSLDEKNRLTLPAKLRGAFEDGVVVTSGLDGCLEAYPRSTWEGLADRIGGLDSLSSESRLLKRRVFSSATQAELDRQGRLVLPVKLLEKAEITREVAVIGVHDHLEIWDRSTWQLKQREAEGRAEDVAERLANRD
jgi:MraZ protein